MSEGPLLRVVRGEPDDAELAALTAVVAAMASARRPAEAPATSRWADRRRALRGELPRGQGAWRASALPG